MDLSQQRLDSSPIRSNMANLTRLGVFTRTMEHFLGRLAKDFPAPRVTVPSETLKRYGERTGRLPDAQSSEGRRRLEVAAADWWRGWSRPEGAFFRGTLARANPIIGCRVFPQ